nr:MAG TPA: hypothetical protein [Caudoviricetes sp.]
MPEAKSQPTAAYRRSDIAKIQLKSKQTKP